ncbi:MAG: hypothetical protein ACI361_01850 [Atopobiaceae bacterium]
MKKPSSTARLTTDILAVVFLIATFMTGHADPHIHALFGLLLAIVLVVHAVQAHKKIAVTTRNVTKKFMDPRTRLDCCLGIAMLVFLVAALVGGGSLMHMRIAERMSFEDAQGTAAGIVHMCSAALFLICAIVHIVLNRDALDRLLPAKKA